MIVYNKDKTLILDDYDLSKGYLTEEIITKHKEEVQEVKEIGHWETIKEYPNGGKDVEWVVDVPGVEYQPARDIEEIITVYVPYEESYFKKKRIDELKTLLANSDYRAIKYAEGIYTEEQYAPYKAERQAYRDEINRLQEELGIFEK